MSIKLKKLDRYLPLINSLEVCLFTFVSPIYKTASVKNCVFYVYKLCYISKMFLMRKDCADIFELFLLVRLDSYMKKENHLVLLNTKLAFRVANFSFLSYVFFRKRFCCSVNIFFLCIIELEQKTHSGV